MGTSCGFSATGLEHNRIQFAMWQTFLTSRHASTGFVSRSLFRTQQKESKADTNRMYSNACSGGGLHEAQRHKGFNDANRTGRSDACT